MSHQYSRLASPSQESVVAPTQAPAQASESLTTATPPAPQEYTVNLDTLRTSLTVVRNGLNKGCEKGAFSLEEAEVLAQSVKYLLEVGQALEKSGVRRNQTTQA